MGDHATLAPSGAYRWVACPGSVRLTASLPEGPEAPSKDADWGTACHQALAECLEGDFSPQALVGKDVTVEHDPPYGPYIHRFTQEDADNIRHAYEYVRSRIAEYGPGTLVLIEEKVFPGANFHTLQLDTDTLELRPQPVLDRNDQPVFADICWGSPDIVLIGGGYIEIIDYKNGQRHVDEVENLQTLLYMLGAMREVTVEQAPQRARLTIVQPRSREKPDQPVRTWEFPKDGDNTSLDMQVLDYAVKFGEAAEEAVFGSDPRLQVGDHCDFCPAKAICPAHTKVVAEALAGDMSSLDGGLIEALSQEPGSLTAEQRAHVLDSEEMIRSWLKAVKAHALKLAQRGTPTPGYKLVRGRRGDRKWGVPEEELVAKFRNFSRVGDDGKASGGKLKKDEYLETRLLSPAQAEKRIKPLVSARTWNNIEQFIERPEGALTLAPATDPRAEVAPTTSEDAFREAEASDASTAETDELPDFLT